MSGPGGNHNEDNLRPVMDMDIENSNDRMAHDSNKLNVSNCNDMKCDLTSDEIININNMLKSHALMHVNDRSIRNRYNYNLNQINNNVNIIDDELPMDVIVPCELTTNQQLKLRKLLIDKKKLFASDPKNPGTTTVIQHRVYTGDHPPISRPPYRNSNKENEVIQKEVEEMLDNDVIRQSNSPWSAPVVLVKKKDGSVRFCIDYRKLNEITKRDVYPLPRIENCLNALDGAKWFSFIDLASGYWQISMNENDKEKTAFITQDGLYEFNVMPFGLTNAPATFQRLMNMVLAGYKWKKLLVYFD